ncbi:MAG: hypothetical protein JNL01_07935 [Bdellovibrionales bacterium]|nr:hypothetical protein [Bdellovibrionales bacterium]
MNAWIGMILFLSAFSGSAQAQEVPQALQAMKEGEDAIKKLDGHCAKCEAQKKAEKKVEGLFDRRTLLKVKITGQFSGKLKGDGGPGFNVPDHRLTQSPGMIEIKSHGQKFPVQLQRRGGGRGTCPVPLLKVIWDKKDAQIQGTLFDPLKDNDMKWVSECYFAENGAGFMGKKLNPIEHGSVMMEYLTQRWMEVSGFPAFRVRLAQVHYLDSSKGNRRFVKKMQYGFFIEPDKDVEKRLDVSVLHLKMFKPGYNDIDFMTDAKSDHTLAIPTILIEVLAANWDYDLGKNKNTVVLMKKVQDKKKANLKEVGVYAGVLPYDMAISADIIFQGNESVNSILSRLQSNFEGKTSGFNGEIPNLNVARWKAEFLRYSKELLPKRQAFLDEIQNLPIQMPEGVSKRVAAYFDALQLLVQENSPK